MARFIYDVDKTTRYIDIHKQFQGGLKTVDTDDSLKDIYLREAENISLSEFNFLEKRYGLHNLKEYAPWVSLASTSSIVQGYFEYYVDSNTVHKIIVIEGKIYIDSGSGFNVIANFSYDFENNNNFTNITTDYFPESSSTLSFAENESSLGNENFSGQIKYVFSTANYYYYSGTWQQLGTSFTDSYPVQGFNEGQYYYDTRRQLGYFWDNNNSNKTGFLLKLSEISAAIQSTRPVEGVRIDDKLYIATGTRPVYYKGDGKLYVFPEYQMSDLDIQKRGYNLNSFDIEKELFNKVNFLKKTSSFGSSLDGITVSERSVLVKESVRYPFVPHQFSGSLTFEIAYHMYNNAIFKYWTSGANSFDSGIKPDSTWNNPYVKYTLSSGIYTINDKKFELTLQVRVLRKPAGTQSSEFYEKVPAKITFSKESGFSGSYFCNNFTEHPEILPFGPDALMFPTTAVTTPDGSSVTDMSELKPLIITLNQLNSGYYDYKVEFFTTESSFRYAKDINGDEDRTKLPVKYTTESITGSVEYTNIWVTPEKLQDYNEAPLNTLRVHTCNRVTEHNGRLCFFGNPQHPDYLFFSDISSKEYIPYFYTLQFTNDLQEPITAVNKFMNILVVQSPSYTWGIKGDSPLPLSELEGQIYQKITINPTIGCIAPHSVKNVRNQLYFLSKEGIFTLRALYAEDNRYNVDPIDRNIYNIVPRDTNAIAAYFDDQYWLNFPTTGETLRYYVDKKAWVKDTYAAWNNFGGVHKYINESGKLRFITELSQLETGNPVKIFDIEVDYSLPTDLTKNITSKITTSYLNQNQPFHPKNYKEAKFDFAIQNEYNTSKEPIIGTNYGEAQFGATKYFFFDANLIPRHFYQITLDKNEVTAGTYTVRVNGELRKSGSFLDTNPVSLSWQPIEFQIFDTDTMPYSIEVRSSGLNLGVLTESVAVLYDSTYDHTVTFNTLVLSEEGTLNIDPIDSYTSADVAIPINLGTRTGNWTFGTSNFGNVIVAIKTVKLSGRGYNSKVSVIEDSKSKWTLESLGITYKMKKARSR
jgi:hypothetical protein